MDTKGWIATIIGAITLAAFGIFVYYLIRHVGDGQEQWDRLTYVFGGVEAVAFAAAGFLFGREVNRARAENAEKRADGAQQTANKYLADKSKATASLSSLVKYIESKPLASSPVSDDTKEIRNFVQQAGMGSKAAELTAVIEERHRRTGAALDQRWAELLSFAKGLENP